VITSVSSLTIQPGLNTLVPHIDHGGYILAMYVSPYLDLIFMVY